MTQPTPSYEQRTSLRAGLGARLAQGLRQRLARWRGEEDDAWLCQVREVLVLGHTEAAARRLEWANPATRSAFWVPWLFQGPAPKDFPWDLLARCPKTLARHEQRKALELCLEEGQAEIAVMLIEVGAPYGDLDSNDKGAMGRVLRGQYAALNRPASRQVAEAMMDRDPVWVKGHDLSRIAYREVLDAALDRRPSPDEHRTELTWWAAVSDTPVDADNLLLLLDRGFPGEPVDLLARTLGHQHWDRARALLDWHGFHIPSQVESAAMGWSTTNKTQISAGGFWYAIADRWAQVATPVRMPEDLVDRMMAFPELDPEYIGPWGQTAVQIMASTAGVSGAMAEIASQWRQRQLERDTGAVAAKASTPLRL